MTPTSPKDMYLISSPGLEEVSKKSAIMGEEEGSNRPLQYIACERLCLSAESEGICTGVERLDRLQMFATLYHQCNKGIQLTRRILDRADGPFWLGKGAVEKRLHLFFGPSRITRVLGRVVAS